MKIVQLKLFVLVFKNRSFSKASEEYGLTQPTISDHIKKLEKELGCNLFDRLGRSIIPTKEAEQLYPHALDIIQKTANMQNLKLQGFLGLPMLLSRQ
ncbi:MAG: LysR family transcriptional regulator [Nitrospirae bacterium]|nr:LysR family transcriptional regulator [Nitrospirota bacterium]